METLTKLILNAKGLKDARKLKAINGIIENVHPLDRESGCICDLIQWYDSPEGHGFWEHVHEKIKCISNQHKRKP